MDFYTVCMYLNVNLWCLATAVFYGAEYKILAYLLLRTVTYLMWTMFLAVLAGI